MQKERAIKDMTDFQIIRNRIRRAGRMEAA
jgi:hypothetical protein